MSHPPPLPHAKPETKKSAFVTALGWIAIVCGIIGLPISILSLLMVVARSYGTSQPDPLGFINIVFGPGILIITGIGLLRRKGWARIAAIVILAGIILSDVWRIFRHVSGPKVIVSATGVPTAIMSSGIEYYIYLVPWLIICLFVMLRLLTSRVRAEFPVSDLTRQRNASATSQPLPAPRDESADRLRGWRVGHRGRDCMFYEEWREGTWQCIEIDGEMLLGRAHHIIYFPSPEKWLAYPAWAQYRRDEIISRIKSEFREPDYEYHGGGDSTAASATSAATPSAAVDFTPRSHASTKPSADPPSSWFTLAFVVLLFVALAVFMFWLVKSSLETGLTVMPNRLAHLERTLTREDDAFSFWFATVFYAATGLGASGCAFWLVREAWRIFSRR